MTKYMVLSLFLFQTHAIASTVQDYPVYTNPKTLSSDAKNVRIVDAQVTKVPATYKLEEPWNCDRATNNCHTQEVVVSKIKVVQVSIAYNDGYKDDYGHDEDSYTEINLPISKFSDQQVTSLKSKKRNVRLAALNSLVTLVVRKETVPAERDLCRVVKEEWICDGGTYEENLDVLSVGVVLK